MLLSDIQQVITPRVWEHIKKPLEGYYFNVNKDFFIERINNYGKYYSVGLRDGRNIIVPISEDYSDFCQMVFIVYHEYICEDNYVSTINEDEHWYCRNCGKEFSHEMNFRRDRFKGIFVLTVKEVLLKSIKVKLTVSMIKNLGCRRSES